MASETASNYATYAMSSRSDVTLCNTPADSNSTKDTSRNALSLSESADAAGVFASSLGLLNADTHLKTSLDAFLSDTSNSHPLYDHHLTEQTTVEQTDKMKAVLEKFNATFSQKKKAESQSKQKS